MLGGSLIQAIVPTTERPRLHEGDSLTLHLPQDALRVLADSPAATDEES